MELNGLALFIETIRQGSITKAAKALNKPKSTLSRQLSEFEEHLGVKLIERTTRQLNLTEAGRELYEQAHDLVAELGDIQHNIGAYQRQPKGELTILWPQELFTEQMAELIAEFVHNWPQISFTGDQYSGEAPPPSAKYDLHFVLHQHDLPASDWIARSLMSIPNDLYIATHCQTKAPRDVQGLSQCRCILQNHEREWLFRHGNVRHAVPVSGSLHLSSADMRLQAAIRGLGVVRLPTYLAEPHVRHGALKALNYEEKPVADTLSVIYRSRQQPLKNRLFLEHFQNHLGRLYSQI